MKTIAYAAVMATVAVAAANAQGAYEIMNTSTTQTVGGVTTNVQTNFVSTTTVMPDASPSGMVTPDAAAPVSVPAAVDVPATATAPAASDVKVKLPSGDIISVPDSDAAPWTKDSRLQGYDRFTFDPTSGALVAGKGDAKFADKWDDNGNPVKKPAPAPKPKKVVKKKVVVKTETTTSSDTTPADGGMGGMSNSDTPADTTSGETPAAPSMAVSGTEGQ